MADITQKWFDAFANPAGGFHERLDHNLKPIALPVRLLTQCRQIYVYASAGMDMRGQMDFVLKNYRVAATGGSRFSMSDDSYDLYALAFVLLACAATKNETYARETIGFIDRGFRKEGRVGLVNALNAQLTPQPGELRQNPHMHLLESCLAMMEVSNDPIYRNYADEILDLFFGVFFDGTLGEYFEDNGERHTEKGDLVEAGHHAEWIWLLDRYRDVTGNDDPRIAPAAVALFDFVRQHGHDKTHGGIFNVQKRDGVIVDEKKRIWPVCETLRAARIMGDVELARDMTALLKGDYLQSNGFWIEALNRDLTPASDYYPGTTPYHLYGAGAYMRQ